MKTARLWAAGTLLHSWPGVREDLPECGAVAALSRKDAP